MFKYESSIENMYSFFDSDVMITDWSGSALEYALGLDKPVIFLNLPKKIKNPKYDEIDIMPFEIKIRDKIGTITSIENLDKKLINFFKFK